MAPTVSIVVPSYNNADFIEATIDSILAQTYRDFELVIADHASTDRTWDVIQRYGDDDRVTLLQTEAGGGAKRNWDRVSKAASGTFVKLVCGDDLLYPTIVEQQVEAMLRNPAAVLAASPRSIVDANGRPIVSTRGLGGLRGLHAGSVAIRAAVRSGTNPFGEPACVLIRRSDLETADWWDSRWPYLIDQATYTRLLLKGDLIGVGTEPLAAFRVSAGQWSVRLAQSQASATTAYHGWLRSEHPEIVSGGDARIGRARAYGNAAARRLAYLYLGRRMRAAASAIDAPTNGS